MGHAVRQVGADGCRDAYAEAPLGQGRYGLGAAAGIEYGHGCGPDEAVHGERYESGHGAGFSIARTNS